MICSPNLKTQKWQMKFEGIFGFRIFWSIAVAILVMIGRDLAKIWAVKIVHSKIHLKTKTTIIRNLFEITSWFSHILVSTLMPLKKHQETDNQTRLKEPKPTKRIIWKFVLTWFVHQISRSRNDIQNLKVPLYSEYFNPLQSWFWCWLDEVRLRFEWSKLFIYHKYVPHP